MFDEKELKKLRWTRNFTIAISIIILSTFWIFIWQITKCTKAIPVITIIIFGLNGFIWLLTDIYCFVKSIHVAKVLWNTSERSKLLAAYFLTFIYWCIQIAIIAIGLAIGIIIVGKPVCPEGESNIRHSTLLIIVYIAQTIVGLLQQFVKFSYIKLKTRQILNGKAEHRPHESGYSLMQLFFGFAFNQDVSWSSQLTEFYSICCNVFEFISMPDQNNETCEVFETSAKLFIAQGHGNPGDYYFYGQTFATKYGINSYFTSNASYIGTYINNGPRCDPNTTCSQSFIFNDMQFEFVLEGQYFDFIVGELIYRNGMYFKNKNVPYTSTDPCWTHNGSIPYYEAYYGKNNTYETSFCCVKFQSNKLGPTAPSTTSSLSSTNSPSFTLVPVCTGVKLMYFLNDSNTNETYAKFSFNLNVDIDENNATYPNIVTFSNYSGWHINDTFEFNDTISFYKPYLYDENITYTSCFLNSTCTFHIANDMLSFKLYFSKYTIFFEKNELKSGIGYYDDGTLSYTNHGYYLNMEDNSCVANAYESFFHINGNSILCCSNYNYVNIPNFSNEICLEFVTNAKIYDDPYSRNGYFYAHSFITPYGQNTYIVSNISDYFGPLLSYQTRCYSIDGHHTSFCSQPFPLSDFQYGFFANLYILHKQNQVGEVIRRNGMYFRHNNIAYTSADPCWTYNGSIPFADNEHYESSFCCTKFGPSDDIHTGVPSLLPTEASVTSPLPTTQPIPTTATSRLSSSQPPVNTITSPLPSLQPSTVGIGTPCSNDISRTWLDIIFVIDTSSTMGKYNLKDVTGGLVTIIQTFNIAQTGDHTTRVGIITYATSVTVRYQLKDVTSFNDVEQAFFKLSSYVNSGDNGVNANDALQKAFDNLVSQKSQRISLIVLIAAGYDENGFQNAYQTAKKIKDNGISIITINFGMFDSLKTELESIGSPGYNYMSDQSDLYNTLPYAFTQVNCFCPINTYQLRNYNAIWKNYTSFADCYYGFNANTNPIVANSMCDPGVLAAISSLTKLDFITDNIIPNALHGSKKFTIGLHKSVDDSTWKWWNYDKSEYPYDYSYPNMSQTPDPSDNYGYMWNYHGFNWKLQTGKNIALPYICQMRACDASYICDQSPLKIFP